MRRTDVNDTAFVPCSKSSMDLKLQTYKDTIRKKGRRYDVYICECAGIVHENELAAAGSKATRGLNPPPPVKTPICSTKEG